MRRWLCAIVVVASCGEPLGEDVPSDAGAADGGVEAAESGSADGGTPDGGSPDADLYDAPPDVHTGCGAGISCEPTFGCCVQNTLENCNDLGNCVGGTFLSCSVSSQCGTGRCCVTPDDAGTYIATGKCRAACAPGDLMLCDKDDGLQNHGCPSGKSCSGANLGKWGLAGVSSFAGCQPP